MKIFKLLSAILILIAIMHSCDDDDFEIPEGRFPTTAVNFESINSVYDDYNSATSSELYNEFHYLFSSNRNSDGENFDIINFLVDFKFADKTKQVEFNATETGPWYFDDLKEIVNTPHNEFGPFLTTSADKMYDLFFYASDSLENLDIYYTIHNVYNTNWDEALPLSKINTDHNEAYFTTNRNQDAIYFCSDAEDDYNIYTVDLSESVSFVNWLSTEEIPVWESCDYINSASDDKCPYINGSIMVFASDRDGGYGGYDLYYSELKNGEWTAPVNFGENINSEYDEFRPITLYAHYYLNDLMFFSSNRPGGLGGFDLYYVGIDKLIP